MKVTVKADLLVNAVRKMAMGMDGKDAIISVTVSEEEKSKYIMGFEVASTFRAQTQIAVTVSEEGEKNVVFPRLFIDSVNSLKKLGNVITLDFGEKSCKISAGQGSIPVPYADGELPEDNQLEPIGSLKLKVSEFKAAVGEVGNFVVPASSDSMGWTNGIGLWTMRMEDMLYARFCGASKAAVSVKDIVICGANNLESFPRLVLPQTSVCRISSLLEGDEVVMYLMGKKDSEEKMIPKQIVMLDASKSMYQFALYAMSYGEVEGILLSYIPSSKFIATIDKAELVSAISVASLLDDDAISLSDNNGKLRVANALGTAFVDVDMEYNGEYINNMFNPAVLSRALSGIKTDKVKLHNNGTGTRPLPYIEKMLVVQPDEEAFSATLLTPVVTNAQASAAKAAEKEKKIHDKAEKEKAESEGVNDKEDETK